MTTDRLSVLFATPELAPYFRAGRLADFSRALPAELRRVGVDVTIVTPFYGGFEPAAHQLAERLASLSVELDGKRHEIRILEGKTHDGVRVFFLCNDALFARSPFYGDYADNALRFGLFSKAVCELVDKLPIAVDVIHCNDWHTGLVPVFLEEVYFKSEKLASVTVLSTLHDLMYQGHFPPSVLRQLGLSADLNHPDHLEFYGKINFLKGAVLYSDLLTTLSPTYAEEIQTKAGGNGLEGVLARRKDDMVGIRIGLDERLFNPANDRAIAATFDPTELNGKRQCKAALQRELSLPLRPAKALLGFAGPLVEPRGLDLVSDILDDLMDRDVQLVMLGRGEKHYETAVRSWVKEFPKNVVHFVSDDEAALRRLVAGADILLLPSRHEPSSHLHALAMRYGTLPVARRIGSYADGIEPWAPGKANATGFLFDRYDADEFFNATMDALDRFENEDEWRALQVAAMQPGVNWRQTAEAFVAAYKQIVL